MNLYPKDSTMPIGAEYLKKKRKQKESSSAKSSMMSSVKTTISLANVKDGLLPLLSTLNLVKPRDEVLTIDFDWHNIKGDICPITINVKKGV